MKPWGRGEFWGVGSEYDFDWVLTESQKKLRDDLMEVCRTKIRPHAIHCDQTYEFPRKSLDALGDLGLLGLTIPKEMGGLGENHICAAMLVETLARYGCSSTAMVYTMHLGACATLLFRYHDNPHIQKLLKRIPKEKLVGALSGSDPATGGHDWFPLTSKVKVLDKQLVQLLKYGSWVTGAGHSDFYCIISVSPQFEGNYSNLCMFLVYKDEVRASTDDWSALGMHGNQSGPLVVEGTFSMERMIGPPDDGRKSIDECIDPYFLLLTSSVWNGIALACMDIAKKHVTKKAHADVGMRVCDYPAIQDYFGESVIDTNTSRSMVFLFAQTLDKCTNGNDWSLHSDLDYLPRTGYVHWLWQIKFSAAKNVGKVADRMLFASGGSGYKTDLGLERLIRDGKAGWVMAPSNEILRNLIGLTALTGFEAIDLWEESVNERVMNREVKKMTAEQKAAIGQKLLDEAAKEMGGNSEKHPYQESDFDNPFNTAPPSVADKAIKTADGVSHQPALNPSSWVSLSLDSRTDLTKNTSSFVFKLPRETDHTGCLPGQYIKVRVTIEGKEHVRYFSPVSPPDDFGRIVLVLKFETQGIISRFFKGLNPGDKVEFQGPSGGFEYTSNQLDEVTILVSGGGITPGLQLIRSITSDSSDTTRLTILYFADTLNDILYRAELDKYTDNAGKVRVIYTLGEEPEGWEGEEGFIDTQMIDKYVTKPNGGKHKILICGGPTMSISCVYSLHSLGYPPENVFIYGQFGAEQVKAVYGKNVRLSGHRSDGVL